MLGGLNNLYRMSLLLTADIRGFTTGLERAESRLLAFSSKANRFGQSLNRGVGLAFAFVGAASVKAAADFNRADTILGQIVGRTSLDPLTKQAKELGRSSIFLATEASAAQLELAKLGFQAGEVNKVLDRSVKLATVFGSDLDATGRTVASTLRQFGLTLRGDDGLENVAQVTDVMAAAFKNSALDLTKFRESMKNVGPTARATGLDLVETTSLLAVLANNAVDGSLGGTKLRSTLSDLAKQFPDVAEALKDLENGTLTYSELVELLNKRAALVGAIFQNSGREIRDFERILRNASGTLDEMTEGIEDNLFFQVERLSNAFRAVGIEIGDALTPVVKLLAEAFEGLASSLEKVDEKRLQAIVSAISGLVIVGGATQALGFFGITLGRVSALAKTLGGNLIFLNRPLNLISLSLNALFFRLNSAFGIAEGSVGSFFAANRVTNMIKGLGGASLAVTGLAASMGALVKLTLGGEVLGVRFIKEFESAADKAAARAEARAENIKANQEAVAALKDKDPFGLEDLQEATGNTVLAEVNADLVFFGEKLIEARKDLEGLQEAGVTSGEFFESLGPYIEDLEFSITLNGRLAQILQKVADKEEERLNYDNAKRIAEEVKESERLLEVTRQIQAASLRQVQESTSPTVFGQSFMFDELTATEQMIALMSGKGIATADEFANSLENIEMPEEGFIDVELEEDLERLTDAFGKIISGMKGASVVAYSFANSVGEAFLQAANSTQTFWQAFKDSFLSAFKAVVAKLITLITLYTILAIVSAGASVAAGGTASGGFKAFTGANKLGGFLASGFGVSTPSTRSASITGGSGDRDGIRVEGAVSGSNLVIMNKRGTHAFDRTFG